jgi:hypothetical protein
MIDLTYKLPNTGNYMVVIKPDHSITSEKLLSIPELEQLRSGVGGSIEIVPRFIKFIKRDCVAFCDEEGKMKGKQFNLLAHTFWEACVGRKIVEDHLVGDIVIIVGSPSFLMRL